MDTLRTIIMLVSLTLVAALGAGLYLWNRREKAKENVDGQAAIANITTALRAAAFSIVTQLERGGSAGMGELKLSTAVAELLKVIPAQYRGQFSAQVLTEIVENTLDTAKAKWRENPALLGK